MELEFFGDPGAFLAVAGEHLAREPVLNTVVATVADREAREAAVAEVSRRIVAAGSRACLFTDQANPTSNRLYETLGYRRVVDMANLRVEAPGE